MRSLRVLSWLALWAGAAQGQPYIADLDVSQEGHQLLVSFQLVDAFDEAFLERIESGLLTQLRYRIKLERVRRWWFDNTRKRSTLEVAVTHNAVTREYLIHYKQDGRLIDSRIVRKVEEVERAMTIIHALPIFAFEELPTRRLKVRVRAELGSRTFLWLIPTTAHTEWVESGKFRTAPGDSGV